MIRVMVRVYRVRARARTIGLGLGGGPAGLADGEASEQRAQAGEEAEGERFLLCVVLDLLLCVVLDLVVVHHVGRRGVAVQLDRDEVGDGSGKEKYEDQHAKQCGGALAAEEPAAKMPMGAG